MKFKEPVKGVEIECKVVRLSELRLHRYQRDLSSGLVGKLVNSIGYGFVNPLIVNSKGEVLDGQHRIEALKKLTSSEDPKVPVFVVPDSWELLPLRLNVEKTDNVKDKCTKLHKLYLDQFIENPEMSEVELNAASGYMPCLFTLAFSYCESGLKSPSLVETCIKKFDGIIEQPLMETITIRRLRGERVQELADLVDEIAMENGFRDFNLKKAVISKSTMQLWGRARSAGMDFDDAMSELVETIEMTDWSRFGDR
jgi:hypothetical protein